MLVAARFPIRVERGATAEMDEVLGAYHLWSDGGSSRDDVSVVRSEEKEPPPSPSLSSHKELLVDAKGL